jgi:hypothetical protein
MNRNMLYNYFTGSSPSQSFFYRTGPKDQPKIVKYGAEAVGGFMWWWILWHMWHEPGHVFVSKMIKNKFIYNPEYAELKSVFYKF